MLHKKSLGKQRYLYIYSYNVHVHVHVCQQPCVTMLLLSELYVHVHTCITAKLGAYM